MSIRGTCYRVLMRLAHRFHWHYAPPIYPDGDTLLWCHWCGLRQVVARRDDWKLHISAGGGPVADLAARRKA